MAVTLKQPKVTVQAVLLTAGVLVLSFKMDSDSDSDLLARRGRTCDRVVDPGADRQAEEARAGATSDLIRRFRTPPRENPRSSDRRHLSGDSWRSGDGGSRPDSAPPSPTDSQRQNADSDRRDE
jgi:hypothetical protein